MSDTKPESVKTCNKCGITKNLSLFLTTHNICKDCNNERRRNKYKENEEHRKTLIQRASEFKKQKSQLRQKKLEEYQLSIGIDNKQCRYCNEIKHKDRFRYNRMKCRDCERDEPLEKIKRLIRSRITISLKHNNQNKEKHMIEYLGCSIDNYIRWLEYNDNNYTLENRGTEWHIDHVIPLSKFNIEDEYEQLLAFNWRNTMPLSPTENLQKNNKIIPQQIQEHLNNLIKFHKENNMKLPQEYIDLFAKHLVVRESPKA
jgi:hypothetical protein